MAILFKIGIVMNYKEYGNKLKEIRKFARKNKEHFFDKDIKEFIDYVYLLPPNNYGTRIQNRIIKKLDLIKTASKNKADCINKNNQHIEIKVSIIDDDILNNKLNIVNVMEWKEYIYYFIAFDTRNDFEIYFFELTQEQLNEELKSIKNVRNSTNQNLEKEQHSNITKKFEIKIDSEDWKKWVLKYRCTDKENML